MATAPVLFAADEREELDSLINRRFSHEGKLGTIETNNNIRKVQSESSKFASLLFDQIPNRRVVGTDRNATC